MPTYGLYLSTLVHEFSGIYVRKLSYVYINEEKENIINIETTKNDCGKSIYDLEILNAVLKKQGML